MTRAQHDNLRRIKTTLREIGPFYPEPLARIVSADDMTNIRAMRDVGQIMECTDTGRWFVPA